MKTERNFEDILRAAPKFEPPQLLKQTLITDIRLPSVPVQGWSARGGALAWLHRWWPAFIPAGVSLACAVVFTVQQIEIKELQGDIESLSSVFSASPGVQATAEAPRTETPEPAATEGNEMQTLQRKVRQLSADISELEGLAAVNAKLRAQVAQAPIGATAEEAEALENARQKAMYIQCINNLKQLGLAARVWAVDHGDVCPPSVLVMTNEMATPKILVCPSDTSRTPAADWSSYTAANTSYDYLTPDSPGYQEPSRVMFRCPIHGSICLLDGSVQGAVGKDRPESLVERDGKLYFEPAK